MNFVVEFLSSFLGAPLATAVSSAIPLIELKGGILFARSAKLNFFEAYFYAYLGSTVVFFALYFLLVPILNLLKKIKFFNKFATAVERYFTLKAGAKTYKNAIEGEVVLEEDSKVLKNKFLTVFIFVALPLPLTGVWTGSALAVFLGLDFKRSLLAISLGNLIAGLIISVLAELFIAYVNIILYGLLIIAIFALIIFLVKIVKLSKQNLGE